MKGLSTYWHNIAIAFLFLFVLLQHPVEINTDLEFNNEWSRYEVLPLSSMQLITLEEKQTTP